MRTRILIYLIISLQLFSCKSYKDQVFNTPQKVIVAGTVHNFYPSLSHVEIYVNRLGQPQDELIVELDSLGNFKTSFDTFLPTDFIIRYTTRSFAIAHPNDSIFFEVDGSSRTLTDYTRSIKFSGDSWETNQAISIMNLKYVENNSNSYQNRMAAINNLQLDEYLAHIDSVYNENQKLYNDFIIEATPNEEAKLWAMLYIEQAYFDAIDQYPMAHKDVNVDSNYYEPLTQRIPINFSMLTNAYSMDYYIQNMNSYIRRKTLAISNSNENQNIDSILIYGIIENTDDPLLRQIILFSNIYWKLKSNKIEAFENYQDLIETYITEPFLTYPLNDLYQKVKSELEAPKLVSERIFDKLKHSSASAIIDSILVQNTGKVIYIDCWAVWCAPCIASFPASKRLHEKFEGKDIAFVYLCLESDSIKWKNLVKEHDLKGQNYLLDDDQSKALRDAFEIDGVPHYILINKQGVVFEKHAASPGFETEKIEKLINE